MHETHKQAADGDLASLRFVEAERSPEAATYILR